MLLEERCAICCGRGAVVCVRCEAQLAPGPPLATPLHLDACCALFTYDDTCRPLLTGLKNGNRRDAVAWLADRLAAIGDPAADVVTWAPTSLGRRRRRGFDQAELLAHAVARRWGLRARPVLRRLPGPSQSGRSAEERRTNPCFEAVVATDSVLLIDDVVTTGATVTAAARSLRALGATEVSALVAARAPAPGRAS